MGMEIQKQGEKTESKKNSNHVIFYSTFVIPLSPTYCREVMRDFSQKVVFI